MKIIFLLAFLSICNPIPSSAEVSEAQAILAIVGEAENQGLEGMIAVAEGIRNRGTLKGVYGLRSSRIAKAPSWVFKQAKMAWAASQTTYLVRGATHWENINAFGTPYWAKGMVETVRIGDHVFYAKAVSNA